MLSLKTNPGSVWRKEGIGARCHKWIEIGPRAGNPSKGPRSVCKLRRIGERVVLPSSLPNLGLGRKEFVAERMGRRPDQAHSTSSGKKIRRLAEEKSRVESQFII